MKAVSVTAIRIDRAANTPVLTLREDVAPRRVLDIYIGAPEAASISLALEGERTPRPLTHDLFLASLEALGCSVARAVLTRVVEGTYHADIILVSPSGEEHVVSARPSDAVALALRAHCPLYASDALLDDAAKVPDDASTGESEQGILDEFRDFIENISPEDFGE